MMRKKACILLCCLALPFMLAACGQDGAQLYEGKIGDKMPTYFFDFTVLSAKAVTRDDYTPAEGNTLIDVEVATTNTFGEAIEMYDMDYQLQWGERSAESEDFTVVLDALDEQGAPLTYQLEDGETITFHYVYEAPADVSDFELCYLEDFEDENGNQKYGSIHYVTFTV